jgi:hypothetical protein
MALTKQDPGCCCGGGGCTCPATICVTDCSGMPINGATVTVSTLAPCGTTGSGCCQVCLDALGGAGTYPVMIAATGYTTSTTNVALTCSGTATIQLRTTAQGPSFCITVNGCCTTLAGATVTIAGVTSTTTSSGLVCWAGTVAGTYTWSVSKARFVTQTGMFTISSCSGGTQTQNVDLAAASGYVCAGTGNPYGCCVGLPSASQPALNDPIPTTLFLTDSIAGAITLTYSGGAWTGTTTYTSPGGWCLMAGWTMIINYQWPTPVQADGCTGNDYCGVTISFGGINLCSDGGTGIPCCVPNMFGLNNQCCKSTGPVWAADTISYSSTVPLAMTQTMFALSDNTIVIGGVSICSMIGPCSNPEYGILHLCYAQGAAAVYTLSE